METWIQFLWFCLCMVICGAVFIGLAWVAAIVLQFFLG